MVYYFLTDVETGGLDESRCSLLSVFGQILDEDLGVKDEVSILIKPDDGFYQVEAKAMEINAINIAKHDLLAMKETEAANKFLGFLKTNKIKLRMSENEKFVFAGHNPDLDKRFLKKLLKKANFPHYWVGTSWDDMFTNRVLDTGAIAQFLRLTGNLPKDCNCSLAQLCLHYNIPYVNAHDAKADVTMTRSVLTSMVAQMYQSSKYDLSAYHGGIRSIREQEENREVIECP